MRSVERFAARVAVVAVSSWIAGCSTLVPPPPSSAAYSGQIGPREQAEPTGSAAGSSESSRGEREVALAAWARVLDRFVNDAGEVDFEALRDTRGDLDRYVLHVARLDPASIAGDDERLAHHINGYNALSMYNVIEAGIPATHAGLAKLRFFVLRKLMVAGEPRSLYSYENDLIRPIGEPRIHFALNCSAVSCPVLPRKPFTGAALEVELERETRAFFAHPDNFRIDHESRTVWLSELLDFYPEDFVPAAAPSLLAYANRFAPQPAPAGYRVRFVPYDWTVANQRKGRRARP